MRNSIKSSFPRPPRRERLKKWITRPGPVLAKWRENVCTAAAPDSNLFTAARLQFPRRVCCRLEPLLADGRVNDKNTGYIFALWCALLFALTQKATNLITEGDGTIYVVVSVPSSQSAAEHQFSFLCWYIWQMRYFENFSLLWKMFSVCFRRSAQQKQRRETKSVSRKIKTCLKLDELCSNDLSCVIKTTKHQQVTIIIKSLSQFLNVLAKTQL